MVLSGDQAHGLYEVPPGLALAVEDAASSRSESVKAAPPLARLFHPASLQPSAFLQSVEQRVERGHMEREMSVRAALDQFADLVTVPRSRLENRQDDEFRRALLQLAIQDPLVVIWHSHICYRH